MGSLGTEEVPVTGSTDSILIHTQPTSVFLPTHRFWKEQAGHERKGFTQSELLISLMRLFESHLHHRKRHH